MIPMFFLGSLCGVICWEMFRAWSRSCRATPDPLRHWTPPRSVIRYELDLHDLRELRRRGMKP